MVSHAYNIVRIDEKHERLKTAFETYAPRYEGDSQYDIRTLVGPNVRIEVDGGIDASTTPIVVRGGADTLVAGNAIFGKKDRIKAIRQIQNATRV